GIQGGEGPALLVEVLDDRLHDQVAVGEGTQVDDAVQASPGLVALPGVQLAALDRLVERTAQLLESLLHHLLADLPHHRLEAGARRHLGDAGAHQAAAEHSHLADLHVGSSLPFVACTSSSAGGANSSGAAATGSLASPAPPRRPP